MRAVIQRVKEASVAVDNKKVSSIHSGVVILLGVAMGDTEEDAGFLARKISDLRIFEDEHGKMNLSLLDINGEALIVSQFTLVADMKKKGRRPSFDTVAPPEDARRLYYFFVEKIKEKGLRAETGIFQAEMLVHICNDGPVTFVMDTR